jgi:hypothetical protein
MKRQLIVSFLLVISLILNAQESCVTVSQTQDEADRDANYAHGLNIFNDFSAAFEAGMLDSAARDGFKEVIIPVVVHVVYREDAMNISYDQIASQIAVLNRDFNWLNDDKIKIPEVWRNLGTSAKFTFRLADRDPEGNFTNGVTRTKTTVVDIGTTQQYYLSSAGGVDPWNQAHYMNVWVCELEGSVLGFAILPSKHMSERDGIVMSPKAFGTLGTVRAPYNKGRTFVHEVGHYFGLRHLWGDDDASCNATDYMDDTPVQKDENYGCAKYPSLSCNNGPHGDMFMNYMDYSNDTCALLFTKRQVEFMQLVLKTNRRALFYSNGYTGTTSLHQPNWNVYPNPAIDVVHLEYARTTPETMRLLNALGQTVKSWIPSGEMEVLDLERLPEGWYMLCSESHQQALIIKE